MDQCLVIICEMFIEVKHHLLYEDQEGRSMMITRRFVISKWLAMGDYTVVVRSAIMSRPGNDWSVPLSHPTGTLLISFSLDAQNFLSQSSLAEDVHQGRRQYQASTLETFSALAMFRGPDSRLEEIRTPCTVALLTRLLRGGMSLSFVYLRTIDLYHVYRCTSSRDHRQRPSPGRQYLLHRLPDHYHCNTLGPPVH